MAVVEAARRGQATATDLVETRIPATTNWGQFHKHSTSSSCTRRSKKRKETDNFTVFFVLLGYASVEAARRMLIKLTPDA